MSTDGRPGEEEILSFIRHHLPRSKSVTAVFEQGADHFAFEIDRQFIVKCGKLGTDPDFLRREALILETLADQDEVRAPRFIAFGEHSNREYLCMGRAAGAQLEAWPPDRTGRPPLEGLPRQAILRELGTTIAALHRVNLGSLVEHPAFRDEGYEFRNERKPARADFEKESRYLWDRGIAAIETNRWLSASEVQFLTAYFAENIPRNPSEGVALLHTDIRADHTFIRGRPPRLSALIDFAGAIIGPPALEFLFIWMRWWKRRSDVPRILDAYLEASGAGNAFKRCVNSLRLVGAVARAGSARPELRAAPLVELRGFLDAGGRWPDEPSG